MNYKRFIHHKVLMLAVFGTAMMLATVSAKGQLLSDTAMAATDTPVRSVTAMTQSKRVMVDPSASTKTTTVNTQTAKKTANVTANSPQLPMITPPKISLGLFVDPVMASQGRTDVISSRPVATWFGGWNANVRADVSVAVDKSSTNGQVSTLVAYNIPVRDCGSYSAGGANSSEGYRAWIREFAAGIGPRKAIVILEPDALPGLDCLSQSGQAQRLADLSYAVSVLSGTGANTYLDAGNYSWQSVSTMVPRLRAAGVASARGFSLNVSGYGWTDRTISYGQQLSAALGGGKGFVMDTSRNGQGPTADNQWCNPRGRGLGKSPTTSTGIASLDAYLWIKVPGESDGECNGGPSAGTWWPEIADELARNARL